MAHLLALDETHITSARLSLRAFSRDDVAEVAAPITPAVYRFINWDAWPTRSGLSGIWQDWLDMMAAGSGLALVIRRRERSELIGMGGLHFLAECEPTAGLWIRDSMQGQGFGGEALAAMASWAFSAGDARCLYFPVFDNHEPSRRIAERLGGMRSDADPLEKAPVYRGDMVLYRIPRLHAPAERAAATSVGRRGGRGV
ncbi:MAG: GNAT family N-acetyltransferase [Alphaproteobacteria bacterium]|nr:GNAT family N-acetyltransferase [Alphaproteobacteria bacterium]